MALAKDRAPHDSRMGSFQVCSLYGNVLGGSSLQVSDLSSPGIYGFDEYQATNYPPEEAHSVINFKSGYDNLMRHSSGSLLSFEQNEPIPQNTCSKISHHQDEYSIWENNLNNPKCSTNLRLLENFNSHQTATSYGSMSNTLKEKQHEEEIFGWFYSEETAPNDSIQESGAEEASFHKRPHTGENMQALKKQCSSALRKPKPKSITTKDPQSIAAKNRRERISERLKILQELVPNGSKVDLVTMLEKAISYVKFLQLQVKVLATDEFWPVQGGKAPEISQVKEAIDVILSSQRDRNSSSK